MSGVTIVWCSVCEWLGGVYVCPSVCVSVGIVEDHVVHIVERDPLPVERESHSEDSGFTPAHMDMSMHAQTHTHTHIRTYIYTLACTHACTHTHA